MNVKRLSAGKSCLQASRAGRFICNIMNMQIIFSGSLDVMPGGCEGLNGEKQAETLLKQDGVPVDSNTNHFGDNITFSSHWGTVPPKSGIVNLSILVQLQHLQLFLKRKPCQY